MKAKIALLTILLAGLSAIPSRADQVTTTTYSTSGFTVDSSQDLILSVLPGVSGNTGSTSIPSLTDGLAPLSIPGYDGSNTLNNGVVVTWDLGAAATINEIQTYSAWPGDRYVQDYTVDVSLDGTTWTNGVIAVVAQGTAAPAGPDNWHNVKVAVTTHDSSPLADNVRYVRFNFPSQPLGNGAVGYQEFVINGVSFALPEAPVFTEIPLSQTVTNGESVTFTAQATGFPPPSIAWHFVDAGSVDHLLATVGNTLTIPMVNILTDAGQYYAVASNASGTVSSTPVAVLTINPGQVTQTNDNSGSPFAPMDANNLIRGNPGMNVALNTFDTQNGWTPANLTDGNTQGPSAVGNGVGVYSLIGNNGTITYDLGAPCTITGIGSWTGWAGGGRDNQNYTVSYSLDGTTFTPLWTVNNSPNQSHGNAVSLAITDLTDVVSIKFVFGSQQNSGVAYTELAVYGTGPFTPEAPVFTEIPQDQTVTNGDSVTFTAQATGFPVPTLTWHFIDSSSVDHLLSTVGNTLTFPSQLADAGQYYAVASNAAGTVNSTPAAVLTVTPTIVTNRNFAANAAAFTEGASYFGGGNPEAAPGWTGGSGINGTLTPAPDYFGPANAGGLTYLFMQGAKTVTQEITTTVGTRYLFSFKAACRQGNVVGLTVWADNTQAPNLTIPDGGLSGASFQDYSFIFTGSGTQTIQFVNSGTGDFTADVTDVSVTEDTGSPEAPVFTEIPQSQTVTGGDNVTFTAQATGYPTPIITWHFIDSSSVDHTLSTVGNTLTFTAKSVDAGEYYAVASNSVATVPSTPAAVLTVNPGLVDETDLSLSGGSFAALGSNDLILGNAGSSALSITTDGDGVGSASLLTDGNLGAPQTGGPLGITGGVITYDLGSGANGAGYDITGIRSLSAWADGGRFKPKYTVSYSVDGLNFTPLWTVDYNTATGNGADVSLAINSLKNVRYVKFDFSGGQQNGWVSYRELAVFGTSSAGSDPFAGWINGLDWSAFTSPDLTPTGDPDGDGMSNQQEFAFGLDPRFGSSVNPITQQLNQASGTFKYTRTKSSGLSYVYQYSSTLSEPWDAFESETPLPDSVSISDTVEEVTVTLPATLLSGKTKLFVRVKAQ